jgi:hypothetical protein
MTCEKEDLYSGTCLTGSIWTRATASMSCILKKNVCESLLGLLLNMADKTKDGLKSRVDLEVLGIRRGLWSKDVETEMPDNFDKIKTNYPPACFTLSKDKIRRFFKCFEDVKVTSRYCGHEVS